MKRREKLRSAGGFTLVEMLVVISVFGLILTLIGLEFVSVVDNTLHTRANTDAESQARIVMGKVTTHMRTAFFDVTDAVPGSPRPVASPYQTSAPYVTFYRVAKGGLGGPIPPCPAGGIHNGGEPCPPYELVTIQMNALNPGELDEIITSMPGGNAQPPIILGRNVTSFIVTSPTTSSTQYNIDLTVSVPSGHCGGPTKSCSFTLDNVVYVGGSE